MSTADLTKQNFSFICRTCLQNDASLTSIFDSKAADMLNECNFCQISENDGYPKQICHTCLNILEQTYKFKQQCLSSEDKLHKFQQEQHEANLTDFNEDTLEEIEISKSQEDEVKGDFTFLDEPLPPPLPHRCQQCSQSFNEPDDLRIHQSIHSDDLICLACLKKFTGRQSLKRHLKIHFSKKPHICKICNKSFSESYALTKHLKRHSGIPREKRHFCQECGQGFSEPYYLNVHLRKHTGERPLVCQDCFKAFADPRSFKIHMMIHSGERPYKCHICQKQFIQNANLTKHLRIHTGEKPYFCGVCDKKFSQSSSLEKHKRTHIGTAKFGCSKCDKSFMGKAALVNHENTHNENKEHVCKQCYCGFKTKSELLMHYNEHYEARTKSDKEKSFGCQICLKRFIYKSSLKKHLKIHRNDI